MLYSSGGHQKARETKWKIKWSQDFSTCADFEPGEGTGSQPSKAIQPCHCQGFATTGDAVGHLAVINLFKIIICWISWQTANCQETF